MLLLLKLFYVLQKLVFVSLTNYGTPNINPPLVKAKPEKKTDKKSKEIEKCF